MCYPNAPGKGAPPSLLTELDNAQIAIIAELVAPTAYPENMTPFSLMAVYEETGEASFRFPVLVKGTLPVGRHVIDLKNITCPVLNIMAKRDDLVPCSQSRPFNDLVGSRDKEILELNAGHIGLAVGSRAQRELWPHAV